MAESKEAFGARVQGIVSTAYIGFSLFLGHDVGLPDILAKNEEPRTSQEIAEAGNLKERKGQPWSLANGWHWYVRELLGALVMAEIVELDASGEKYSLPGHRAAALTPDTPSSFDLGLCLPRFGGSMYSRIEECFKKEGPRGISYDSIGGVMDSIANYTGKFFRKSLIPDIILTNPELKEKLEKGIAMLDLSCGQGVSTVKLAGTFPKSTVCGVDFLERSIKIARDMSAAQKLTNVDFVVHDAANLPANWNRKYDFVFMFDVVHDQARPDRFLSEVYRVLAPGGTCLICDLLSHSKLKDNQEKLDGPSMAMLYTISTLHCMPVSLHFEGGMGLGTCWGREKAEEMITAAGLELVKVDEDPANLMIYYHCKKL